MRQKRSLDRPDTNEKAKKIKRVVESSSESEDVEDDVTSNDMDNNMLSQSQVAKCEYVLEKLMTHKYAKPFIKRLDEVRLDNDIKLIITCVSHICCVLSSLLG